MNNHLWCYLRLLQIKGLGTVGARKLIEEFGDIEKIFEKSSREKIREILSHNTALIKSFDHVSDHDARQLDSEIRFIEKNNIQYSGIADASYPFLLKQCADAPVVLFYRGNMELWPSRSIAFIGTRKATSYGYNFLQNCIEAIQSYDPLIVSGLAIGIDIKAHLTALDCNLPTVAVMGTSLKMIYPKIHTSYAKVIEENGLLVSEYPSWTTSIPEHFVRRNRVIAGLSQAVVVVQSPAKGGSLTTALYANEFNREVYAVPGRVDDTLSEGCLWLIQQNRAQLLYNPQDLITDLNWKQQQKFTSSSQILPKTILKLEQFSLLQQQILKAMTKDPMHIEELASISRLEMSVLNAELMMLELENIVESLPGKMFRLKNIVFS